MRTSELTGAALDWAVAKAQGYKDIVVEHGIVGFEAFRGENWGSRYVARFSPTTPVKAGLTASEQVLLKALEGMIAEFRALDLPYGSKAYSEATSAVRRVKGERNDQ